MELKEYREQIIIALGDSWFPDKTEYRSVKRLKEKCERLEKKVYGANYRAGHLSDLIDASLKGEKFELPTHKPLTELEKKEANQVRYVKRQYGADYEMLIERFHLGVNVIKQILNREGRYA